MPVDPASNYDGFSSAGPQYPGTPYTNQHTAAYNTQYSCEQAFPTSSWSEPYTSFPNTGTPYPASRSPYGATDPFGHAPGTYAPAAPAPVLAPARAPAPAPGVKHCTRCNATSTPLWRRDPASGRTLCNACGLYAQQRHQVRPQALIDADAEDPNAGASLNGPACSHCSARKTSVWRRNKAGELVCNACGCYERLNGKERPLTLKNKVKPRAKQS
ncbi:hypothetical protein GGX14DRAFT_344405 [Mycena pura]|uniref:GATA-type domain-containing protein n=1 Tax=Mycena pura TaxID=153505 RepID=A0AAD6YVD8_9AGAR|nr:hypothetical protein GGX14DRAFT_344405 [Mycena pura]